VSTGRHRCVVASTLLLISTACNRDPAARTRQYIQHGDELAKSGKYEAASIEYLNAIKLTPSSADAHEKLADAATRNRDARTAVNEMLRVAELKPSDPAAQVRAASVYLLAGRFEDARARAQAALKLDEADADAHIALAQALAGLKDQTRSEAELREAVKLAPDAPKPHVALAGALWSAGRPADAEAELRRAVALGPQDVGANRALALLLMATKRAPEAEPFWTTVAHAPNGIPFARVDYLSAMNRLADAERELTDLVSHDSTRDAARIRLAAVQYAMNKRDAAHDTLRAVLQRAPANVPALLLNARFFQTERKLDEALRAAQAAVAADAAHSEPLIVEAGVYAALGDETRAVQALESALKIAPGDPSPYVAIARVRLANGHAQEAVQAADRARQAMPDDLAARVLLIESLSKAGQRSRAMDEARAALGQWPRAADLHVQQGALQAADGRRDDARRSFVAALDIDPKSIVAESALADLDVKDGRAQAALARMDKRLRDDPDNATLQLLSAHVEDAAGERDKAEATLDQMLRRDPSNRDARAALGRLYLASGQLDDAKAQFERLAQSKNAGADTMVGMILEAQKRPKDAQQALERALAANPRDGVAANNLACLYQDEGRLDDALKWAMVANEELRNVPAAKDTLGWIRVQRGEYQQALPLLAANSETQPANVLYRYHLAYAYWKTGSTAHARDEMRRALDSGAEFQGRDEAERILGEIDAAAAKASR
jgi:tetratricopeptide (TPR) repeat protein